ncbi:MAG: hypothetical protein ACOY0T_13035 [Myxococcota bacterium]
MKSHAALLLVALSFACGGHTLDVGSQGGGGESGVSGSKGVGLAPTEGGAPSLGLGGSTPYTGSPNVGGSAPLGAGGASTPTYGGTTPVGGQTSIPTDIVAQSCLGGHEEIWEGYTHDPSDRPMQRWLLSLVVGDDGHLCGTAYFGADGEGPLDPPSDPNAAYPPGVEIVSEQVKGSWPFAVAPWPGTTYTIIEGTQLGTTWRIRLAASELYTKWCRIQESFPYGDHYQCVGPVFYAADQCYYYDSRVVEHEASAMKCSACEEGRVCTCDAKGCFARDAWPITFELVRQNEIGFIGTVTETYQQIPVAFTRMSLLPR